MLKALVICSVIILSLYVLWLCACHLSDFIYKYKDQKLKLYVDRTSKFTLILFIVSALFKKYFNYDNISTLFSKFKWLFTILTILFIAVMITDYVGSTQDFRKSHRKYIKYYRNQIKKLKKSRSKYKHSKDICNRKRNKILRSIKSEISIKKKQKKTEIDKYIKPLLVFEIKAIIVIILCCIILMGLLWNN